MSRPPIDLPDNIRSYAQRFGRMSAGWVLVVVIILIWFARGIYTVGPSEVALVKRFGSFVGQEGPGFHYHLPGPIESVVKVDQRSVRTEEVGSRGRDSRARQQESLMLTGDFNIISAETIIQYDIIDAETFAFEVESFRLILRDAAQGVIREKMALRDVDAALTERREEIASEIQDGLQTLLDDYGMGIRIINVRLQQVTPPTPQVAAAFDDVNSAVQDKERIIFEAQRYANEQLPRAEGEAQKILNEAEGYRQSRILRSEGDVARFLAVLERYRLGESVTETRLYIETMEQILPNLQKIIVTKDAGTFNLLNLDSILQPRGGGEVAK